MYKKQLIFICLLLGIISAGVGIGIYRTTSDDYLTYDLLLKSSSPTPHEDKTATLKQSREGVHKKVWIQGPSSSFTSIESENSDLFIFRDGRDVEVIEKLQNVSCFAQEKLYYEQGKPMQVVRHIEAEKATYNYSTEHLSGEGVRMQTYYLPGHSLELPLENPPLSEMTLSSNEAYFDGERLTFTGDVKFVKPGKQYALADQIEYFPHSQSVFLTSFQNRVLFFDQTHNMQLSAPQVQAVRNPKTQKDVVQGIGDVRFTFGAEEFELFKQRFKADGHFRS